MKKKPEMGPGSDRRLREDTGPSGIQGGPVKLLEGISLAVGCDMDGMCGGGGTSH